MSRGPSAPAANAHEFQAESVVDMLRRLLTQFSAERTNAERYAEYSSQSYQLLVADMTQCIEAETKATSDGGPAF